MNFESIVCIFFLNKRNNIHYKSRQTNKSIWIPLANYLQGVNFQFLLKKRGGGIVLYCDVKIDIGLFVFVVS